MPWIWSALALQFLGYVFDALWHGVLHPGAEPKTVGDMVRHLGTVHLPLYLGAASVLVSTGVAFLRRRSAPRLALSIALAGAALSAGAEAWHAASHLRLDTHTAPVAGILSVVGFVVVAAAMIAHARTRRGRAEPTIDGRRAA